ncbi:macrolide ABC transporter ATP-binding protein [candidate division WWE3 bacterium RIFCSPLOWO2_01_FULL_39_13]|uniref:Macrolide ABC transporter ATP-binding protein n=1 Tax=candidate division WWE3 bacterium RIFCSPLOWO2_01_FULL_39_13 TaxID=1802624 RepID=A0A1F4V446_UNCKA|nr:MAG: macrolide ABC transporter ATP-binding protein [candidate division WWE3 bacterium RIFCSPLOWO2_01_FULL_39_13]
MQSKLILEAQHITKTYEIGKVKIEALKNISVQINRSDLISIVGKSGSGKSTLMHIIGLLDSPTSGKIFLNGKDVSCLDETSLAKIRNKEIGFVFQSFNLLQRATALENVLLPLKYSNVPGSEWKNKADEMLEIVGLSHRKYNKSNELSGGQKQRVAIARALVNDPSIILADEPTGNLDTRTGREIMDLFKKLHSKGTTVIIVTHDEDIAKQTKRQIFLKDGEIA